MFPANAPTGFLSAIAANISLLTLPISSPPVSYTHLDVYKRQVKSSTNKIFYTMISAMLVFIVKTVVMFCIHGR